MKSYFIFKVISLEKISNPLIIFAKFALKLNLPIKFILKKTIYSQFCGGENLDECNKTIESLYKKDISTILDYASENNNEESKHHNCLEEVIKNIDFASENKNIPFVVFKFSGIERINILKELSQQIIDISSSKYKILYSKIDKVCSYAFKKNIPIMIDAEESWIQPIIDHLVEEMMIKYNRQETLIFNTIQLYRSDKLDYLKKTIDKFKKQNIKCGFKLVRGAYLEKESHNALKDGNISPINKTKEKTDEDFNNALKICIHNLDIVSICCATHNEKSTNLLIDLIKQNSILAFDKRVYFSQLFGMSDNITSFLAENKFNVAKYLPYGPVKDLIPYITRRAEENKSIKGQMNRELQQLKKEISNRKIFQF
ncbi:proline dehydrogenase family protein [Bacteroidota bacterium]|nr:proline dehydrogenase family protein [Bacteroidota bacterium]